MNATLTQLFEETNRRESGILASEAAENKAAVRLQAEKTQRFRPPYAIDRDRIFYSGAFRRYTGKTQVIYFVSLLDEQLTSRILHTLSVSQISKSIGRLLSLNTDLIEAIALGHDLGHPAFGHDGEYYLSKIGKEFGMGRFLHNIQSLRVVDKIANNGKGLNLTFQVRDGILSHNGEVHNAVLEPNRSKTEKDLIDYVQKSQAGEKVDTLPSTLEGCIVRIADTIAYIGQDIDDAIRIGLIKREDLPQSATALLGSFNNEMVETLINDVVANSAGKNYISFSEKISSALLALKRFNYKAIYKSDKLKTNHKRIENGMRIMFNHFLGQLNNRVESCVIYQHFLNSKSKNYINNTANELKVRDFLAGMTDRYFAKTLSKLVVPEMTDINIYNESHSE